MFGALTRVGDYAKAISARGRGFASAASAGAAVCTALLVEAIRSAARACGQADGLVGTEPAQSATAIGTTFLVKAVRRTAAAGLLQTDVLILADAAE